MSVLMPVKHPLFLERHHSLVNFCLSVLTQRTDFVVGFQFVKLEIFKLINESVNVVEIEAEKLVSLKIFHIPLVWTYGNISYFTLNFREK